MSEPAGVSLCSGFGGLDMVARRLFGGDVVVHGEQYPPACRVLDAHWPGVPNVGDITTADWAPRAGNVDWLTAGWPCQPFSSAGRRLGAEDERAIWPAVARAIRDLGPRVVLLENVGRIVVAGELARALGDLAALGFDAEWRCVRASDAGAPHRRERCFILAVAAHRAGEGWGRYIAQHVDLDGGEAVRAGQTQPGRRCGAAADADGAGLEIDGVEPARQERPAAQRGSGTLADTTGDGRDEGWPEPAGLVGGPDAAQCGGATPADAASCRRRAGEPDDDAGQSDAPGSGVDWASYGPAIRRWEAILGRPAPAPVVVGRRGGRQLSPHFVEWLMGLPAGWVTDVPGLSRNEQLHLLGNGVVPQQAELAYRAMWPELIEECAA